MPSVQKICVGCNTDVANKKRVKDTQGNYYCQSCYEAKLAGKKAAVRAPEPEPVAAAVDPYDFPPEPAAEPLAEPLDTGDIGLADEPQELAPEPMAADMFGCADCKKLVNSKQIRNDDGDFVCAGCFAKRRSRRGTGVAAMKANSGKPGAAQFSSFGEEEEKPATFHDSAIAGLVYTPAVFLANFGILFALSYALPTFKGTGVPIILAIGYSAMTVVTAGLLLISLFFAKLCNAVTLDRFGGKLWKICALSAGLTLIIRVVDHLDIVWSIPFVWLITSIMRYYILRGGIGVIFNIDVSAARIVAIVNTILGAILRLVLYFMMGIAIGAAHLANHEDMDGRPVKDDPAARQLQEAFQKALENARQHQGANDAPADDNAAPADKDAAQPAPAN